MKARLISTGACVLVGASAFLGGCVGVPPAVNPSVEVWDVQPTANTDIADVIIEQLVDQVFSLASSDNDSGCLFWCFHERGARPSHPASQPVAGPVVYQYTSYSEPPRPVTRVTNTAQAPAIKATPRPLHVAAPKPVAPKEHAPRQTTSKPAASSASNKKTDKK